MIQQNNQISSGVNLRDTYTSTGTGTGGNYTYTSYPNTFAPIPPNPWSGGQYPPPYPPSCPDCINRKAEEAKQRQKRTENIDEEIESDASFDRDTVIHDLKLLRTQIATLIAEGNDDSYHLDNALFAVIEALRELDRAE